MVWLLTDTSAPTDQFIVTFNMMSYDSDIFLEIVFNFSQGHFLIFSGTFFDFSGGNFIFS